MNSKLFENIFLSFIFFLFQAQTPWMDDKQDNDDLTTWKVDVFVQVLAGMVNFQESFLLLIVSFVVDIDFL